MPSMNASIRSANPGRLINRLCRHFSHKIEAQWNENQGLLTFSIGQCRITAEGGDLVLECQSPTDHELEELGQVVASHLVRFAGGEVPGISWQTAVA